MNPDVDFLASSSWDADMPARMRWLREHDPVHWSDASQLWVISKYADVNYVSMNHRIFCSGNGVRPGNPVKIGLIDEDEPRHTRLRGLINKGFTPRMVSRLDGPLRRIVADAIDAVAARGACDFVNDIAVPIPLLLIADMIGIRPEDRADFHRWSDDLIAADGNLQDMDVMMKASTAFMEYSAYLADIIEDRRVNPRDDLVSILVGAKDAGTLKDFGGQAIPNTLGTEHTRLANDELIMLLVILLVAGNETTRNAISGGMRLLIENPDARRRLIAEPALLPAAVEEMLRLVSPVHTFGRTATQDTELRGRAIKEGQTVLLLYPSANRDAEQFDDPDVFRIDRDPDHLAFGIGTHFCLGANLARMEMRVTFEQLLRRLPDMEYDGGGPVMKPSALVGSCVSMPVRFTPEGDDRTRAAS